MKIHVPNSFPNNDNCNDEFYVKGAGAFMLLILKYIKDGVVRLFLSLMKL